MTYNRSTYLIIIVLSNSIHYNELIDVKRKFRILATETFIFLKKDAEPSRIFNLKEN